MSDKIMSKIQDLENHKFHTFHEIYIGWIDSK